MIINHITTPRVYYSPNDPSGPQPSSSPQPPNGPDDPTSSDPTVPGAYNSHVLAWLQSSLNKLRGNYSVLR